MTIIASFITNEHNQRDHLSFLRSSYRNWVADEGPMVKGKTKKNGKAIKEKKKRCFMQEILPVCESLGEPQSLQKKTMEYKEKVN